MRLTIALRVRLLLTALGAVMEDDEARRKVNADPGPLRTG